MTASLSLVEYGTGLQSFILQCRKYVDIYYVSEARYVKLSNQREEFHASPPGAEFVREFVERYSIA
jgi:hypothetical protein